MANGLAVVVAAAAVAAVLHVQFEQSINENWVVVFHSTSKNN